GQLEYFTDRVHGALWVGGVPTPAETAEVLGIATHARRDLESEVAGWRDRDCAVLTGFDPEVDALFPRGDDGKRGEVLDELRLIKDEWEIARLQAACDATARGFADVARELPVLLRNGGARGERWLEGTFYRRA